MKSKKLVGITLAAVFAALTYVATTFIRIPAPVGYVNLGDCFVLAGGWLLGPLYGVLAGGIGSMLADLFGFPLYAPATLVIKSLMAFAAAFIGVKLAKGKSPWAAFALRLVSALTGEAVMVAGYFIYEICIYDLSAALAAVPFNLVQGAAGAVTAVLLFEALRAAGLASKLELHK